MPDRQTEIAGVTWARDRVWCLGTLVDGCRHVPWERGVSFADCDVLIVDARSLLRQDPLFTNSDEMRALVHEIDKRSGRSDFMLVCVVSDKRFLASDNPDQGDGPGTGGRGNLPPVYVSEYFWHPDSDNISTHRIEPGATRLDAGWKSTELAKFEALFGNSPDPCLRRGAPHDGAARRSAGVK